MYTAAAGDRHVEAVADFDIATAAAADADFAGTNFEVAGFDAAAAAYADFEGVGIAGEFDVAGASDGEAEVTEVVESFGGDDFAAAADGKRLYGGHGDVNFDIGVVAGVVVETDVPGAVFDIALDVYMDYQSKHRLNFHNVHHDILANNYM